MVASGEGKRAAGGVANEPAIVRWEERDIVQHRSERGKPGLAGERQCHGVQQLFNRPMPWRAMPCRFDGASPLEDPRKAAENAKKHRITFDEAMTVFAVMTAALFPILHLGRPWKFFWLIPYPNWRYIWPQFKSPLVWDVFAILTYFTISSTFLYIGLIPDVAVLRDRENISPIRKRVFTMLSLGWRNTDNEWRHFARAYLFLAALSTPLVLSVHSVVSFDFAMALTPGWHTTIFPPYFVAGAIFSGMGMVFTIIIPLRKWFGVRHYVTINHLDAAAKLALFTSLVVGCAYMNEWFVAWFSGNEFEQNFFANRIWGQWWWASAILYTCNMVLPLSLFVQKLRRNAAWLFIISFTINIGMWFERFVIVVPSLSHEFEPWQWTSYRPTFVDYSILIGSFGWFSMWFLLFIKQLPVIAISEVKEIVPPQLGKLHEHGVDPAGRHFEFEADTPGEFA